MSQETSRRRASVSDVASLAGVSMGTVSNVLNRPGAVSAATRAKVERAMELLQYVPSGAARQLRAGRAATVGCVVLDISNPFFTDMAGGVEERLVRDGLLLMLASSNDDPAREARVLRQFEEHGVAGVLVVPRHTNTEALRALRSRGTEVVLLDAPAPTPEFSSVSVDDVEGGALAAAHLLEAGHRALTFLNGDHAISQCAHRSAGVRQAVVAAGLDPGEVVTEITLPALNAAAGDAAVTALAQSDAVPEAIFCVNDLVAIGAQRALRRWGGYELLAATAMVGYDDIDIAAELAHPLTSVRQPRHEMGYRAADLLVDPGAATEQVVFRPQLVVRASSQTTR